MSKLDQFETIAESAKRIGAARNTITRWANQKYIQSFRVGSRMYVNRDDVDRHADGLVERQELVRRKLGSRPGHEHRWPAATKPAPVVQSAPAVKPTAKVAKAESHDDACAVRLDVLEAKVGTLDIVTDLQRAELRRLVTEAVEAAFKKAFA